MTAVCETIAVRDLRAALSLCGRVVPSRAISDVYRHVRIAAGTVEACDGELRLTVASHNGGETMLLPYSRLQAITAACSGDQIDIECEDAKALLRAGGGRWTLPTVDPHEWPEAAAATGSPVARIPADQLRRALEVVLPATDTESSRYALGGVRIEVEDGIVNFIATDGRRLYHAEVEVDQAVDDCQLLLPARAASLLLTLAKAAADDEVQIERVGEEVTATLSAVVLRCRQLQGAYPRWRDAIPDRPQAGQTVVRADALAAAIRQAAICTSETSRAVNLTLGTTIEIDATSSEAGTSRVELEPIEGGPTVTLAVNPQFCVDWLRSVDPAEPVTLEASDSSSALVLRVEDATGVVMPMGAD